MAKKVVLRVGVSVQKSGSKLKLWYLYLSPVRILKTHFCHAKYKKVSRQTVTPSVTPFPKSTILSTKKGGTTTSHKNTSKMPFILRSKPVETLFLRMAAGAARNKRRLLYYSLFGAYSTVPGQSCMQQIILRCTHLFSCKNGINRRNAAEIPIFPLCSFYSVRQMHMYYLCHSL